MLHIYKENISLIPIPFFLQALVYSLINGFDLIVPQHTALSAASD